MKMRCTYRFYRASHRFRRALYRSCCLSCPRRRRRYRLLYRSVPFSLHIVSFSLVLSQCKGKHKHFTNFLTNFRVLYSDAVNQLPASKRRLQAHRALIKSGSGQVEGSRVGRRKCARPPVEVHQYKLNFCILLTLYIVCRLCTISWARCSPEPA
jgi:hypothetical protein